jgi:hypothetical protein
LNPPISILVPFHRDLRKVDVRFEGQGFTRLPQGVPGDLLD